MTPGDDGAIDDGNAGNLLETSSVLFIVLHLRLVNLFTEVLKSPCLHGLNP